MNGVLIDPDDWVFDPVSGVALLVVEHPTCRRHPPCECGRFSLPHCKLSCELADPSELARWTFIEEHRDAVQLTVGYEPGMHGCVEKPGMCPPGSYCLMDTTCLSRRKNVDYMATGVVDIVPVYEVEEWRRDALLSSPCFVMSDEDNSVRFNNTYGSSFGEPVPKSIKPGKFVVRLTVKPMSTTEEDT